LKNENGLTASNCSGKCQLTKRLEKAKKTKRLGNLVRAAILLVQASRVAPENWKEEALARARAELKGLAVRFREALQLEPTEAAQWAEALVPLLQPAARGIWPVENRLLYDLQKVCLDHEKDLFAVDVLDWALALGRRPFKRPLPFQKAVLKLKHLRRAFRRLKAARISEPDRRRLDALFQQSVENLSENLRVRFGPVLLNALDEVNMIPRNLPERVAQHKLSEELSDRILQRGFFLMSDVRDAISRNNLKLPDLRGLLELITGDRMIRLNRLLQIRLDGVYQGGEIYLRGLQRFSSVVFGTLPGRVLTRYLVLPYGGAFVALEGLKHIVHLAVGLAAHTKVNFLNTTPSMIAGTLILGTFLLGLLHSISFRGMVATILRGLWRVARRLLIQFPAFLLNIPAVKQFLQSTFLSNFCQVVLRPAGYGGFTCFLLWLVGISAPWPAAAGCLVLVIAAVFLNTRIGQVLEAALGQLLFRLWHRISIDFLPEIFRFVMYLSRLFVESVDRAIYEMDEWLRFRTGDSRWALVVKPIVGLFWFVAAYIIRFAINVLLEPQINPIKHFPVVTVSHKLVIPLFVPPFTRFLANTMERHLAGTVALSVGTAIPGAFGFLVWEFKENWKLYESTRPPTLRPVLIGHHGETMLRFLKPGLHSGTVPKLFAKLRKVAGVRQQQVNWKVFRKYQEALQQIEESIRHFIDREFVFLLNASEEFKLSSLFTGEINLAPNRIQVELKCHNLSSRGLEIVFAKPDDCLVAWLAEEGWLEHLSDQQFQKWQTALTGLFKMAGVELFSDRPDHPGKDRGREVYFGNLEVSWINWVRAWETGPQKGIAQAHGSLFDTLPACAK